VSADRASVGPELTLIASLPSKFCSLASPVVLPISRCETPHRQTSASLPMDIDHHDQCLAGCFLAVVAEGRYDFFLLITERVFSQPRVVSLVISNLSWEVSIPLAL